MKKASLAAAFAASLFLGSMPVCQAAEGAPVEDACAAEERVLGSADDDARFLAYQTFTREIAASVVVKTSLDQALAESGVPGATMLEALRALAATVNLERDVRPGDRLHVRYEQTFTAEGATVGVGRVMWAELTLASRGPLAIHRFRTHDKVERLWFVNGLSATPPSMRMPLDTVSVSSGFGARADPFDQPRALAATGKAAPMGGPTKNKALPSSLPAGGASGNGGAINLATPLGASLGLAPYGGFHAPAARGPSATPPSMRMPLDTVSVSSGFGARADPFDQPRALAATGKAAPMGGPTKNKALPSGLPAGGASGNGGAINLATPLGASLGLAPYGGFHAPAARGPSALSMHEGIDLVAPAGTPVYAAADGVVVDAAPNGRYGNWIHIDHGGKIATVYGHLMAFAPGIEPGEAVVRGELIGFVGSTGRSTGAHLHFEVLDNGKPVNPITHPELKTMQLRGLDLERFRKQVVHSLEERTREGKVASAGQ